jgi:glycosyltransferase involved in cell wall biosynthesis
MLAKWREGYDVVYATRAARREDTRAKRLSADWFYRFYNRMTTVPIPAHAGDFRLMDARVVAALRQLPERNRFMKGLFGWLGFRQTAVAYERPPRTEGTTSFNYWRLWNFALDGLTSFSTVPLRIWSYLGFVVALIAFFYATILIGRTLIFGIDVPGYTSLMVTILFLGGVQLLSLGIMGEYLGRTYNEVKQRPVYLVDRIYAASRGGMEAAETAESDREPAA